MTLPTAFVYVQTTHDTALAGKMTTADSVSGITFSVYGKHIPTRLNRVGGLDLLPPNLMRLIDTLRRLQPLDEVQDAFRSAEVVSPQMRLHRAFAEATRHAALVNRIVATQDYWNGILHTFPELLTEVADQRTSQALALLDSLQRWAWELRQYEDTATRFGPTMLALGWPPPAEPPLESMEHVLELYDLYHCGEWTLDETKQELETVMLLWYNPEVLLALCDRWSSHSFLEQRRNVLKQAIQAHAEERYYLTIPVVLAQIEGMIADGFNHRGRMSQATYRDYLDSLLESKTPAALDKWVKEYTLTTVLVGFEHGTPIASELSRHAIMHGADTSYGTAANSLKAILLFDHIQAAVAESRQNAEPHSKVP